MKALQAFSEELVRARQQLEQVKARVEDLEKKVYELILADNEGKGIEIEIPGATFSISLEQEYEHDMLFLAANLTKEQMVAHSKLTFSSLRKAAKQDPLIANLIKRSRKPKAGKKKLEVCLKEGSVSHPSQINARWVNAAELPSDTLYDSCSERREEIPSCSDPFPDLNVA